MLCRVWAIVAVLSIVKIDVGAEESPQVPKAEWTRSPWVQQARGLTESVVVSAAVSERLEIWL